jgi:hypothetical protein
VVEHVLGKNGVMGSNPIVGFSVALSSLSKTRLPGKVLSLLRRTIEEWEKKYTSERSRM